MNIHRVENKGVYVITVTGGKYIEVASGIELFVQDIGKGDPMVFIPGFTFTSEVFSKQVDHFSKTNRVIVIDPRSHGRSTMTLHGNDYITHGADLAKIMSHLEIQQATIVGWSFGCFTTWEYFARYGADRIKSMVLVDMPPKSLSIQDDDWTEGALDDMAAVYNTYLRNPTGQRTFISDYITQVMMQGDVAPAELTWLVEQSLRTPYYIAGNLFASGMFADYREQAKKASDTVPTLTVVAQHWAKTATSYIQRVYPSSKVEVLGGHMMFWEHADRFNTMVADFLKS